MIRIPGRRPLPVRRAARARPPPRRPHRHCSLSDPLAVTDGRQLTGKRLALPLPDCSARPSDCDDMRLLNQLDGFDLYHRQIEIGFGQPIDLSRVTRETTSTSSPPPAARGSRSTGSSSARPGTRFTGTRARSSPSARATASSSPTRSAARPRHDVHDHECDRRSASRCARSSTTGAPTPPPAFPRRRSAGWTSCAPTAPARSSRPPTSARIRRYDDTGKAARGVARAQCGYFRRRAVRVRLLPLALVARRRTARSPPPRRAPALRRSRAPRRSASR